MPDEPWTANITEIYESLSNGHPLTEDDRDMLESADFSEDALRDAFEEGFLQSANPASPIFNEDVSPDDRRTIRELVLNYFSYLGYHDRREFWDKWREWIDAES